jgi:hypothetical protein
VPASCSRQPVAGPGKGVDPLPDQAGHLLGARQQQWAGAEGQPIPGAFDRPLLVGPNPVGKQRQLHVMHDAVAMEAVAARVGHKALHRPGLFLGGPAEEVASGEPNAARPRDQHGKAAVGGVEQGAECVGAHRVGDPAVIGLVLPRAQLPGPDQRLVPVHIAHGDLPDGILKASRRELRHHPH